MISLTIEMFTHVPKKYSIFSMAKRTFRIFPGLCHELAFQEEDSLNPQVRVPDHADLKVCSLWDSDDKEIKKIKNGLLRDMYVLNNFITEAEEQAVLAEVEPILKKLRYEFDHWDDVIHGFRETERTVWKGLGAEVLQRARNVAIPPPEVALPHTHVLDLDPKGYIKPHVDAVRFCGNTVAGVCLLSPAVMRLRHSERSDLFADFLLTQRCMYMMKGVARYDFSHEILMADLSYFKGEQIIRSRRISVIARSQPNPTKS